MTSEELDAGIAELVRNASYTARRAFALETIRLMHQGLVRTIKEEFGEEEQRLLDTLMGHLPDWPVASLAEKLRLLDQSTGADPIRAIEFHPSLTELLGAIESWLHFRNTGKQKHICEIAISRVNMVDYDIGGDIGDYSIFNMLGDSRMDAEYHRIQDHLLPEGRQE
jgi:hypothetical protein